MDSLDLFDLARDSGTPGYDNPLNHAIFSKLRKHASLRDRIVKVTTREFAPSEGAYAQADG